MMQPPEAERLGSRQLFESLKSRVAPLPPGFLEDLAVRFENEGLEEIVNDSGMPS